MMALTKKKKGMLETLWGENIQSLTKKGFDSLSGDQVKGGVSDSSKIWALVTGKMVDLLRDVRKGDCFGGKS